MSEASAIPVPPLDLPDDPTRQARWPRSSARLSASFTRM
jgi:hypothetical protein